MVAAQVDTTVGAVASLIDASYDVWSLLYDEDTAENPTLTFVRDDPSAPHYPLAIYHDGNLRGRALVDSTQRPLWSVVEAAFGEFLAGATTRLLGNKQASENTSMEAV